MVCSTETLKPHLFIWCRTRCGGVDHDLVETKIDQEINFLVNFLEIEMQGDVEFIGQPTTVESRPAMRETRIVLEQRDTRERDEVTMVRYARENPHLVQAETKFF